jgi:hypothetical protein
MGDILRRLRALALAEHDDLSVADEAADEIEAAYRCIIAGTRAFCPPIENGADIRRWFDEHDTTIQAVLAWKEAQKQTSVCEARAGDE